MQNNNPLPEPHNAVSEMFEMLSEDERKIVNTLAIKKAVSGTITPHDVAAAFLARRRMHKVEPQSAELENFIQKFERLIKA